MSVKIIHKETAQKFEVSITDIDMQETVDTYCTLAEELEEAQAALDPLKNKAAELKKQIDAYIATEKEPDESGVVSGNKYDYQFGQKAMGVTGVDKKLLRKTLGKDTFFELAAVKIGDIRKYCSPPQIKKILTESRVGGRKVKIVRK